MTEFSSSPIYFRGGSAQSRRFFDALYRTTNLAGFQDKFFREYYRSGNVFIYRFDSVVDEAGVKKITSTFGLSQATKFSIPARYIILQPADIRSGGYLSFGTGEFYKALNEFEIAQLRNPKTPEDKDVLKSLPPVVREQIKQRTANEILLPLEEERLCAVFYKKQDYEPMAIPMGYPVLDDLEWKAELKKMDMAACRTMQQVILLITMGAEPEKGGVNHKHIEMVRQMFENESIGRVMVGDYTMDGKFIIPDIAELLDPKKYAVVDEDIRVGLNSILIGNEKFANQSIKIRVFMERLKKARQEFLNEFLIPEIRRIAEELNFKNYPTPYFEDIDLKDEMEWARIVTRLYEVGLVTPDESLTAIETGRLPDSAESIESQEKAKQLRDKGFYEPVLGGPFTQNKLAETNLDGQKELAKMSLQQKAQEPGVKKPVPTQKQPSNTGRPPGTKKKQTTKKMTPIGGSFSLSKVKENILVAEKVLTEIETQLSKRFKTKKLTDEQKAAAEGILEVIVANEEPEQWLETVDDYVAEPIDTNPERVEEITNLAYEHQVDPYLASLLFASKI